MLLRHVFGLLAVPAALAAITLLPQTAQANTVTGSIEPLTPSGQHLALKMTIDDESTTFELTGPDFSWFAFGFDTMTMMGYSLIVEGTDDNRTVVEQNLQGIGNPGAPQSSQDIQLISTVHDEANNLTTIVLDRPNETGDPNDPIFSPSMTSLPVIWAHDSFATPAEPNPTLTYHGFGGRGFATINFSVVPEPAGLLLAGLSAVALLFRDMRRTTNP
jgi:hypothetical protein